MIATAIITADRPVPTLRASYDSFRAAGFTHHVALFSDATLPSQVSMRPTGIQLYRNNMPPLGNLRNWTLALRSLHDLTDAQWLMVCEDDITWCPGAADALYGELGVDLATIASLQQNVGAISLYCPRRASDQLERRYANGRYLKPGYYSINQGAKTWGAQCLMLSREQAGLLLQSDQFLHYLQSNKDRQIDAIVADCLFTMSLEIAYRIPCLVNHDLGAGNSSLGYPTVRPQLETKYYTGQP